MQTVGAIVRDNESYALVAGPTVLIVWDSIALKSRVCYTCQRAEDVMVPAERLTAGESLLLAHPSASSRRAWSRSNVRVGRARFAPVSCPSSPTRAPTFRGASRARAAQSAAADGRPLAIDAPAERSSSGWPSLSPGFLSQCSGFGSVPACYQTRFAADQRARVRASPSARKSLALTLVLNRREQG